MKLKKQSALPVPPAIAAVLEQVAREPERYLIKEKPHRQVYLVPAESGGYVVKWFRPVALRKQLRAMINPMPIAAREYWVSQYLRRHGIPTAAPVAWFCTNYRINCCFVAALLPTTTTIEEYFLADSTSPLREETLSEYAKLLAAAHRIGLYIDDFGLHNVLVDPKQRPPALWIVDHEATRPFAGYLSKWRKKNLRSGVEGIRDDVLSPAERAHFVASYHEAMHSTGETATGG